MITPTSTGRRPENLLRPPAVFSHTLTTLAAGLLAACSAPGANQPPPVTTLHLAEYRITPASVSLDAGSHSFTAINSGGINHALELSGNGIDGHTPDLAYSPGHSEGFTLTLKPGTYKFFCPVDGHRGLGMQATLVVR